MWIDRLTASNTTRALELAADFAEQRHRVLAENLANIDVPDFHSRRLDAQHFETALRAALDSAEKTGTRGLELRGNAQVSTTSGGRLETRAVEESASNALFHDGTNAQVEKLLTDVANNTLSYETAMSLLKGKYDLLLRAIRGRTA
jgi:flagellar basal-body rod protein FlgB